MPVTLKAKIKSDHILGLILRAVYIHSRFRLYVLKVGMYVLIIPTINLYVCMFKQLSSTCLFILMSWYMWRNWIFYTQGTII